MERFVYIFIIPVTVTFFVLGLDGIHDRQEVVERKQHCIETLSGIFPGFDTSPEVCDSILYAPLK